MQARQISWSTDSKIQSNSNKLSFFDEKTLKFAKTDMSEIYPTLFLCPDSKIQDQTTLEKSLLRNFTALD